jgi:hypothetical protein
VVVIRSNTTHGELEGLNKTDGLFDGAVYVEVVGGDLARRNVSGQHTQLQDQVQSCCGTVASDRVVGLLVPL